MNDTYLDDLPNGNLYLVTQLESAINLGRCLIIICFLAGCPIVYFLCAMFKNSIQGVSY